MLCSTRSISVDHVTARAQFRDGALAQLLVCGKNGRTNPGAQLRIRKQFCLRKYPDHEGRTRGDSHEQLSRNGFEPSPESVTDDSDTHSLGDDETKSSGCRCVCVQFCRNCKTFRTNSNTATRNSAIIIAVRDAVRVSEHRGYAERTLRPFARRRARTARPARVRMRRRKPCVLARLRLLGWKVRLDIIFSGISTPNIRGKRHWTPAKGQPVQVTPKRRAGQATLELLRTNTTPVEFCHDSPRISYRVFLTDG